MERSDWLKERQSGIGGSDVAAILGISNFKTAYRIWQEKTAAVPIETPDNKFMKAGRMFEATVAEMYAEETGREVIAVEGLSRSKEYPFLIGNVDRFIVADPDRKDVPEIHRGEGVLEMKTTGIYTYKQWEQEIPVYYYTQMMHYLYVTGLQWGAFAIMIWPELRVFPVVRDESFIQEMVQKCVDFWTNHVQTNIPPPKEASDFALSKQLIGSPVLASTEILDTLRTLATVKARMKQDEEREKDLSDQVKKFMGDHDTLLGDDRPLATWKIQAGREYVDQKKLKAEQPDIYAQYLKSTQPSRILRLKITGDDNE